MPTRSARRRIARSARRHPFDARPGHEPAEHALPGDGDDRVGARSTSTQSSCDLVGDRHQRPRRGSRATTPAAATGRTGTPRAINVCTPARRASRRCGRSDPRAGRPSRMSTPASRSASSSCALGRLGVDADHRRRPQPQPGRRQCRVRDAAAEPPAARVVGRDVAAGRADVDDLDASGGPWDLPWLSGAARASGAAYTAAPEAASTRRPRVFFYELHEGDDEVYSRPDRRQRVRVGAAGVLRPRPAHPPRRPGRLRAGHARSRRSPRSSSATTGSSSSATTSWPPPSTCRPRKTDNFLAELEVDEDDEDDDEDEDAEWQARRATFGRSSPSSTPIADGLN